MIAIFRFKKAFQVGSPWAWFVLNSFFQSFYLVNVENYVNYNLVGINYKKCISFNGQKMRQLVRKVSAISFKWS